MFRTIKEQIHTIFREDPAAKSIIEILLCYPGFHAIISHRLAHWLHRRKVPLLPRLISQTNRFFTGIEIHPGARIGRRFFIDHGMGVVIGETTEIGDDVLLYKGVVLGGVALERTKRHPTLGSGVVVGSNAVVLGPIEIGESSRVGSGAVVVKPVPAYATVVGVPARVVRVNGVRCRRRPGLHHEQLPDVLTQTISELQVRVDHLEAQIEDLRKDEGIPVETITEHGAGQWA